MSIPWTYSRLSAFETCPRQFYHLKVKKDVHDPPTEHTIWGEKVHTAMESRVRDGVPLPEGMHQWEGVVSKIAAFPGEKFPEYKLSIDKNFQPTPWDKAWARGIADLLVVNGDQAAVLDYKTGRRKPSEQLQLYGGMVFATFPEVQVVKTSFVWLKDKQFNNEEFVRSEVPNLWRPLIERVAKLEAAYSKDVWLPNPSGLCRQWCPVMACEHNGRRNRL